MGIMRPQAQLFSSFFTFSSVQAHQRGRIMIFFTLFHLQPTERLIHANSGSDTDSVHVPQWSSRLTESIRNFWTYPNERWGSESLYKLVSLLRNSQKSPEAAFSILLLKVESYYIISYSTKWNVKNEENKEDLSSEQFFFVLENTSWSKIYALHLERRREHILKVI